MTNDWLEIAAKIVERSWKHLPPDVVARRIRALSPNVAEQSRLFSLGGDHAVSVLTRLIANYQTDRDEIADSDLDREQPVTIKFRGTLADIRNAEVAIQSLRAALSRAEQVKS